MQHLTVARRPRLVTRWWASNGFGLLVALGLPLAMTVPTGVFDQPATVERLTITNPTVFNLTVDVNDGGTGGWMPLTIVDRESDLVAQTVIDQGPTWQFRVRGQGRDGGTFTIARADLLAHNFTITIPPEVAARLAAQGAPPSPH